jgi:magnesium-protoporphyrin O-methyltransferase
MAVEGPDMACCCLHNCDTGRLFSRFARRYRKRYERRGFEPSQRQLLDGIRRAGIGGVRLLEIGCGVGALHQRLIEEGAAAAQGIDLSERMLAEAREAASSHGLSERVDYRLGDFVEIAESVDPADVTILDKVICCYPDAEGLVQKSLARTQRVYAYTIPRDRWFTRIGAELLAFGLRLLGSRFRSYVHDPQQVESWVRAAGFEKRYEDRTFIWMTEVYVRA